MAIALARGADVETYRDLRRMVYSLAYTLGRKYKFELSEAISLAHYHYHLAYVDWDYTKGNFQMYVCARITHGMIDEKRMLSRRAAKLKRHDVPEDIEDRQKTGFDLESFLLDLSPDARTLVVSTLEAGQEWFVRYGPDNPQPRSQKKAVRQVMRHIGWSDCRIRAAWLEVRRKLT